jgi:hypothetical protein
LGSSMRHSAAVHRPPPTAAAVRVARTLLAAGLVALSIWQANLTRDSPAAHWSVALLVLAGVGAAIVLGRGRQDRTTRRWVGQNLHLVRAWRTQPRPLLVSAICWTVLIGGVVGWDLTSFVVQSHTFPTLSYFIGHVTRYPLGRGLLFALWLGVGAYLVSARRIERPQ